LTERVGSGTFAPLVDVSPQDSPHPTLGAFMEQRIAVLVSAVFCLALLAIFANVARLAGSTGNADEIAADAARWRKLSFWSLVVLFIPVIGFSLTKLPYGPAAGGGPTVAINATGTQWSWNVSPATVAVGQSVEFMVTAADVNHGFGLYDPSNRLVAQTQAMPGYTNVMRYTFATPGTYRVLCLEYCGLGHHSMFAQIDVQAATTASNR
jgi:cytochrome c oxidase subunit 2